MKGLSQKDITMLTERIKRQYQGLVPEHALNQDWYFVRDAEGMLIDVAADNQEVIQICKADGSYPPYIVQICTLSTKG